MYAGKKYIDKWFKIIDGMVCITNYKPHEESDRGVMLCQDYIAWVRCNIKFQRDW